MKPVTLRMPADWVGAPNRFPVSDAQPVVGGSSPDMPESYRNPSLPTGSRTDQTWSLWTALRKESIVERRPGVSATTLRARGVAAAQNRQADRSRPSREMPPSPLTGPRRTRAARRLLVAEGGHATGRVHAARSALH